MSVTSNIYNELISKQLSLGCNRLCILSAYATSNMASWLIKSFEKMNISVSVSIIVGMTVFDGISTSVHSGFTDLVSKIPFFQCSYVFDGPPVHYNLYIWLNDEKPVKAFASTAHFTQSSFIGGQKEFYKECDPGEAYQLYSDVESSTIYCNHAEVEDAIVLRTTHPILDSENTNIPISGYGLKSVSLSLLARGGETGKHSGLNWGQRNGRDPNQAYIHLPAQIARSGFFPLKNDRHFMVVTDDRHQLTLRVEQANNKAITTPLRNADLGEYFRNRLGLAYGAFVTRADLERYGRTDVTFYKIDDEQFYMDFSV